jgi:tetratricopeptide (TPR) repeat protein
MASWHQRLLPLAACIAVIATTPVLAQAEIKKPADQAVSPLTKDLNTSLDKLQKPTAQKARDAAEEKIRLQKVTQDANAFAGMLASELSLLQGNTGGALGAYVVMFERSGRPELAERAMQIAINGGGYNEAQLVLERWRKVEPVPTQLQKQMAWELDASRGNVGTALSDFPDVLTQANEAQVRRVFLLLSQLSLAGPQVAGQGYDNVMAATKRYPNMSEAAVVEAMYAALSGHDKQAVSALNRLARLDADIRPTTQLAIGLLAQKSPQVINQFFSQADASKLSDMWRELQIDTLVRTEQYDKAFQLIQNELSQNPTPELQLQAGILAMKKKDYRDAEVFLSKVYQGGDVAQRNRAATLLAVVAFGQDKPAKGVEWAAKIDDADYQFDKGVILATAAAERKDWAEMRKHLDTIQASKPSANSLYEQAQAQRLELLWIYNQKDPMVVYNEYSKKIDEQMTSGTPDVNLLAELYAQRGILLADKLNRPEDALKDLQKQLVLRPDDANAMNALGYTMLAQEASREQGFVLVEQAYKLEPQAPHINDSLGWAYFLKGQPEKAVAYLKFAYDKMPDAEVAAHLVDTYMALGQERKAREFAKKGLEQDSTHAVLLETLTRHHMQPKSAPSAAAASQVETGGKP